ncbi:cobalt transport protein CbiN [Gottschalkia purinilytica]|uniref:Cobalt transport protein CbiN n=1 Tax=Gottschalkia purinilytica TaxID=1503 RepID=A0A0L0W7Q8_GOTPU|nr:energy-coupling factor ABC transporter substrate-binding protein [Gottschalkia purinilytica]KNF07340.1 cobalt transport protein CbiN [Gottschalkia purinilytica]
MENKRTNILLILALVLVVGSSLVIGSRTGDLEGADALAEEHILESNKDFEPWFEHIWEPPSGEIESALFALQAAIGGMVIGYYIGVKKNAKNDNKSFESQ